MNNVVSLKKGDWADWHPRDALLMIAMRGRGPFRVKNVIGSGHVRVIPKGKGDDFSFLADVRMLLLYEEEAII